MNSKISHFIFFLKTIKCLRIPFFNKEKHLIYVEKASVFLTSQQNSKFKLSDDRRSRMNLSSRMKLGKWFTKEELKVYIDLLFTNMSEIVIDVEINQNPITTTKFHSFAKYFASMICWDLIGNRRQVPFSMDWNNTQLNCCPEKPKCWGYSLELLEKKTRKVLGIMTFPEYMSNYK